MKYLVRIACSTSILVSGLSLPAQVTTPSTSKSQGTARPEASTSITRLLESTGELLVSMIRPADHPDESERWQSYESPRHAALTFKHAMDKVRIGQDEAWELALGAVPGGSREAAENLDGVLLRIGEIQATDLPGPDRVAEQRMSRYVLFPSGERHSWIWDALSKPPEGQLVLIKQRDGSWAFDSETVEGAAELRESLQGLPPFLDDDRPGEAVRSLFAPSFQRADWEDWVIFGLIIGGGLLLGFFVRRLLKSSSAKFREQDAETIAGALNSFATPSALLIAAIALAFGTGFIHLGPTLNSLRWSLVQVLLLIAVGWLAIDLLDVLATQARRFIGGPEDEYAQMAVHAFRRVVRVVAFVILALFIFQNMLDVNVTAFVGGVGLIGLALSLAAQNTVKNLFGAVMIFMNRPFVIGDWVRFKEALGSVEEVGLQATRIRLASGELWTVPNMHFTEDPVENLHERRYLRREMNLTLVFGTSSEKLSEALQICEEVLQEDQIVEEGHFQLDSHGPEISFSDFGPHYLNLRIYYWYFFEEGDVVQRESERGWFQYLDHCELVNKRILERFNEAGIEFAFPTETVFFGNDPKDPTSERAEKTGDSDGEERRRYSQDGNREPKQRSAAKARLPGGEDELDNSEASDDGDGDN